MKKPIATMALMLSSLALLTLTREARAAGVVGNGTAASCTEASFTAALAGGGNVTFNCGGTKTILLTSPKTITTSTTIEGGYKTTLSGGGKTNLFVVNASARLILAGINLDSAVGNALPGAAITSHGALMLNTVQITKSQVTGSLNGGAVYLDGPSLFVQNSTFDNNTATSGGALYVNSPTAVVQIVGSEFGHNTATAPLTAGGGGALYIASDRQFTMKDSLLRFNTAATGGAVYLAPGATATFTGTPPASPTDPVPLEFVVNTATSNGGAIFNGGGATLAIDYADFTDNKALPDANGNGGGPGGAIDNGGTLTLTHGMMYGNTSMVGGALFVENGAAGNQAITTIETTSFEHNHATIYGGGVALLGSGGAPVVEISDSAFDANLADIAGAGAARLSGTLMVTNASFTNDSAPNGGGIFAKKWSGDTPGASVFVQNATFSGESGVGGAMYNAGSGIELASATITGSGKGVAVYASGGTIWLADDVLANFGYIVGGLLSNCWADTGGTIVDQGSNFANDVSCGLTATTMLIGHPSRQGKGLDPLLGPLTQDPHGVTWFQRPAGTSPLVDQGVGCLPTDQIGEARSGAACDIGAIECIGLTCTGSGTNG
jgi:predicted outer membrane repeat protein